ncbi:MAG: hypothetical protein M3290_01380, partial [Actinomycetota bacterium]|nr:hypothetical protein [Actinomycetota bacterium]
MTKPVSGTHALVLHDGTVESDPFEIDLWDSRPPEQWHRVAEAELTLYQDPECGSAREVKGVALESHEGERTFIRVFPFNITFTPGAYVDWEWDPVPESVGRTWIKTAAGPKEVFSSSGLFAGAETHPTEAPRQHGFELRPKEVQLRPGMSIPVVAQDHYSDGIGRWRTVRAAHGITSDNPVVAFADDRGAVRAKKPGRAVIRGRSGALYDEMTVEVSTVAKGHAIEFLGGIQNPVGLATTTDSLIIVNQSDRIRRVNRDCLLEEVARIEVPARAQGLDTIATDPAENFWVRTLWDRAVLRLEAEGGYTRSFRIPLPEEAAAPMSIVCD